MNKYDEDKILGMFTGASLGDSLGAPHEFKQEKYGKYTGKLEHPITFVKSYGHGTFISAVGSVSDDTELLLTLTKSIIDNNGKYNRNDVIMSYLGWANDDRNFFMGKNTRKLLKGVKTIKGYEARMNKLTDKDNMQSNGALMRCCVLSLLNDEDVINDVMLTNPNKICVDAELCYIEVLRNILFKNITNKDELLDIIEKKVKTKEVLDIIKSVRNNELRDVQTNKGWVLHGLYCALYSLNFKSYKEGIDYVIRLYGDCDSNGIIAGAILGAKYGYQEMCKDDVTKYNIDVLMNYDPNKSDIPKSELLHPKLFIDYTKQLCKTLNK